MKPLRQQPVDTIDGLGVGVGTDLQHFLIVFRFFYRHASGSIMDAYLSYSATADGLPTTINRITEEDATAIAAKIA
jgi:hypothetical protein